MNARPGTDAQGNEAAALTRLEHFRRRLAAHQLLEEVLLGAATGAFLAAWIHLFAKVLPVPSPWLLTGGTIVAAVILAHFRAGRGRPTLVDAARLVDRLAGERGRVEAVAVAVPAAAKPVGLGVHASTIARGALDDITRVEGTVRWPVPRTLGWLLAAGAVLFAGALLPVVPGSPSGRAARARDDRAAWQAGLEDSAATILDSSAGTPGDRLVARELEELAKALERGEDIESFLTRLEASRKLVSGQEKMLRSLREILAATPSIEGAERLHNALAARLGEPDPGGAGERGSSRPGAGASTAAGTSAFRSRLERELKAFVEDPATPEEMRSACLPLLRAVGGSDPDAVERELAGLAERIEKAAGIESLTRAEARLAAIHRSVDPGVRTRFDPADAVREGVSAEGGRDGVDTGDPVRVIVDPRSGGYDPRFDRFVQRYFEARGGSSRRGAPR